MRVAVVGAGWAGIAAAVRLVQAGHRVTLYEMAPAPGGRARSVVDRRDAPPQVGVAERAPSGDPPLGMDHGRAPFVRDNGQHILIGAYARSLDLMRTVGADPEALLLRLPLTLVQPDGSGLALRPGPAAPAFAAAVLRNGRWPWRARLRLLAGAARWQMTGFRCKPAWTVARLTQGWPAVLQDELIEPLCIAALNTPASQASAQVFLRVLRDGLFSGPGASDLLIARRPLGEVLPEPAMRWLQAHGASLQLRRRVQRIVRGDRAASWRVDDEPHDAVVVATTASEAARLVEPIHPEWAQAAALLQFHPIATVWIDGRAGPRSQPMCLLPAQSAHGSDRGAGPAPDGSAAIAFDLGAIGHPTGGWAIVVSGADAWTGEAVSRHAQSLLDQALRAGLIEQPAAIVRVSIERRATFACTPALQRPGGCIAPGLYAAADFIGGPYPATLEGAVRSGEAAAARCTRDRTGSASHAR